MQKTYYKSDLEYETFFRNTFKEINYERNNIVKDLFEESKEIVENKEKIVLFEQF